MSIFKIKRGLALTFVAMLFSTNLVFGADDINVTDEEKQVIELYIATFNRAPDKAGLDYWVGEMKNRHWTLEDVASSFFDQKETKELYPEDTTLEDFINTVYLNVLNRQSDKGGVKYWKEQLEKGNITKQKFIISIINAAKSPTGGKKDKKVLENKVEAGLYFAIDMGLNDATLAKNIVREVTDDETSLFKVREDVLKATVNTDTPKMDTTNCKVLEDTTISEDTTLKGCYNINNNLYVNKDVLLTIEGNSILIFNEGKSLSINGFIKAVGTKEAPIVFTGKEKTEGYWGGIAINYSNSVKNEFRHVYIEYGNDGYGAIDTSGKTRLKLSDVVIKKSSENGFAFSSDTILDEFKRVHSTQNKKLAGTLYADSFSALDDSSFFLNNKEDYILLRGTLTKDAVWKRTTAPALVENITIEKEAFLTIEKGSRFIFKAGQGLNVKGALKVAGEEKEPVLFSGKEKTKGYWDNISFSYTDDLRNEISNAIIEYGGSSHALIDTWGKTKLKIENTKLANSQEEGFTLSSDADLIKFSNNQLIDNELTAGTLYPNQVDALDNTTIVSGNKGGDYITLKGGTLEKDATWKALTVPLLVEGGVVVDKNKFLTIEPGANFRFAQNATFNVKGAIKAIGTEEKMITFKGKQATSGYWGGMDISYSNDERNELAYIDVEDADIGINFWGETQIKINNSIFANNSKYAISLSSDTTYNQDLESNNTFKDNGLGDIEFP